jgi:hypothetical protein
VRVLSLGAGQQSAAVYLLAATGEIEPIDYSIFADTGEEPKWVYEQIEILRDYRTAAGYAGAPILVRWLTDSEGRQVRLGDNLLNGNDRRFASIPAFVKNLAEFDRRGRNTQGKSKRQCTRDFKTSVVERAIRRELLGLAPAQAYKGPRITQLFGFDRREGNRIVRTKDRLANEVLSIGEYPLWDLEWTRADCQSYVWELTGRDFLPSACTFCPLVNTAFRRLIRDYDPAGHARACAVDAGLRVPGAAASKMLEGELYVHRSMKPLAQVDLDAGDDGLFPEFAGCEGFCGH